MDQFINFFALTIYKSKINLKEDERNEFLQDDKRLEHLYKYYYIHEIIEEYNQHIR